MPKFAKPTFAELLANYRTEASSVHACTLIDPTKESINTCAARMSEALVLTNKLAKDRSAIARLGPGKGSGEAFLLGKYNYAKYGKLCPHGIGRGAQDLGAFLNASWGGRTKGWATQADHHAPPNDIKGRHGVVVYMKIPGFGGQGHIDLWNDQGPVGSQYWASETIWFWELP